MFQTVSADCARSTSSGDILEQPVVVPMPHFHVVFIEENGEVSTEFSEHRADVSPDMR
jgi:hypothetical protein